MSYSLHPSIRKLLHPTSHRVFRNSWDRKVVAQLPIEYQKFYTEWMDSEDKETPVHWIPKRGKWERNPETGEVKPIQNEPIHVNYPVEMHDGLWGGEGVVQGLVKKGKWRSPVPKFWPPNLRRNVIYSEILNTYLCVVVTERAMKLIDKHHGLDDYLITTPAYDLKSLLALKLKKKILTALLEKNFCNDNPNRKTELLNKYSEYILPRNELEWYGLSVSEAIEKSKQLKEASLLRVPLKAQYRADLIEELKREKIEQQTVASQTEESSSGGSSWVSKLNPFSRNQ